MGAAVSEVRVSPPSLRLARTTRAVSIVALIVSVEPRGRGGDAVRRAGTTRRDNGPSLPGDTKCLLLDLASKARTRIAVWGSVAYIALAALACAFAGACGSSTSGGGPGPVPTGTGSSGNDSGPGITPVGDGGGSIGNLFNDGSIGSSEDGGVGYQDASLPENFAVPTELGGGYALGPPPSSGDGTDAGFVQSGSTNCSLVVGVVRDFLSYGLQDGGDPDFETFVTRGHPRSRPEGARLRSKARLQQRVRPREHRQPRASTGSR